MGIFGFLKDSAKLANDEVQSELLLRGVRSTFSIMEELSPQNKGEILYLTAELMDLTVPKLERATREGKLQIAKLL